ncbi:MAG: hypothetical protein GX660_17915, partial [Clostridiaceae bacterium]|nr:hypothetical protein [Clostridiaceae bacterium]
YYGIDLKILRELTDDDWQGRIKDIHIELTAKTLVSSKDKPISVKLNIVPKDERQKAVIENLQNNDRLKLPSSPNLCFLDEKGQVASEEMRFWLPRQLSILDKEEGGPYNEEIILEDKYIEVNDGEGNGELVKIDLLIVTYFVESFSAEIISHGEQVVDAILKDFNTNDIEYVKRNK